MLKYVYILISEENDCYSEQALASIYSLRQHNKAAEIVVLTDSHSLNVKKETLSRIHELVNEISTPILPDGLTSTQKSRYIKTTLPQILEGEFLYIDNDTIITSDISEIAKINCEIGMVYNRHREDWSNLGVHPMLIEYHNKTGVRSEIDNFITDFYNAGIILCKNNESSKRFFNKWHDLWKVSAVQYGYGKDQPDLWRANYQLGNIIKPIDGIWNCQLLHLDNSLQFINGAKIIHYFSSMDFLQGLYIKNIEFFLKIKRQGITDNDKIKILEIKKEILKIIKEKVIDYQPIPLTPMVFIGNELSKRLPFSDRIGKIILKIFGITLNGPNRD